MHKGTWYNATVYKRLNGKIFEDNLKSGHKYRKYLMCYVDVYEK